MIHRFQEAQENQGNLVVLEDQGLHFSQEYQEGLDLPWGLEVHDHWEGGWELLEVVDKLHNILQMGSQGWDSLILDHHILYHRREQILSHRRIFGMVLASRHLYPHRTDQDGSILLQ